MKKIFNKKTIYVRTRYGNHLCVIEPDEEKGLIITASGLPGVITWGRTLAESKKMVKEAIELCIESLAEEVIFPISNKEGHIAY